MLGLNGSCQTWQVYGDALAPLLNPTEPVSVRLSSV